MTGGARRVYATDRAPTCPKCHRLVAACRCKRRPDARPTDGVVRVSRSTKGRRGKGVTLVAGVPLSGAALQALARELKAACGAGGAVKDGVIEVQGDHRDALVPLLARRGWTVKRAGG